MRGQMIIEFVILFGAVLLIAAVIFSIGGRIASDTTETRHQRAALAQLESVQNEITAAALARDGYRYDLRIGPRLGVIMNTTINGTFALVETQRYENAIRIPSVNGSVSLSAGTISIRKTNGTVSVS